MRLETVVSLLALSVANADQGISEILCLRDGGNCENNEFKTNANADEGLSAVLCLRDGDNCESNEVKNSDLKSNENAVDISNIVDQKFAKIEFESKNTNQNVDSPVDADLDIPILCLRDGGNCKETNQNVDNVDIPVDADQGISPILCLRYGGNCEGTITTPITTTSTTTTTTTRSSTTTTTTTSTTTTTTSTNTTTSTTTTSTTSTTAASTTTTPRPSPTESPRLFPSPTPRSKPISPSLSLPRDICKLDDPTRYLVPHPTDCNKFVSCQWLGVKNLNQM